MQVIDVLRMNRSYLELQEKWSIRVGDVKYIPLYDEYMRMQDEGQKTVYIVASLAEKYGITARAVYGILRRLEKVVK